MENRIIKFRAWNQIDEQMSDPFQIRYSTIMWRSRKETAVSYRSLLPSDILMQFSGLTDKLGEEIYEGDLVNFAIKERHCECGQGDFTTTTSFCPGCGRKVELSDFVRVATVEYSKAGFALFYKDEKYRSYRWSYHAAENFIAWIEVIGNIFEHRHLIENK